MRHSRETMRARKPPGFAATNQDTAAKKIKVNAFATVRLIISLRTLHPESSRGAALECRHG